MSVSVSVYVYVCVCVCVCFDANISWWAVGCLTSYTQGPYLAGRIMEAQQSSATGVRKWRLQAAARPFDMLRSREREREMYM